MPEAANANPTAVNPFNGLSDDTKAAAHFESLWQSGAADSQDPKEAAQLRNERGQFQQPSQPPQQAVEPASDEPSAQPEPVAADPEYANVEDYLAKANIEPDSFYSLPVTVKIDGKTSQVKLADVLKSYQLEGHVQQKSIALADKQREWEGTQAQQKQALEQNLSQAKELGNLAHQWLLAEYQKIDWNQLRATNPGEWVVLNTEFNQRAAAIQNHLAQVQQKQQELAQEQQNALKERLPKEQEQMLAARPEWRDAKQFQEARDGISDYARKLGFTDAEIGGIFDHRFMLILHDAARFAQLQASSPQAAKRVRAAPQMATPGARTMRDPQQVVRTQAKEQFLKNRKDPAAQERYFSTLA